MHDWLGVASKEHVQRGVRLGIAQIGHGKRGGLAKMAAGDGLVIYSPRVRLEDSTAFRCFTAIGEVADDEIWQADEGDFQPWRRRVTYHGKATEIPLAALRDKLELTRAPNWGYQLRRGLIPLSNHDFHVIREAMGAGS